MITFENLEIEQCVLSALTKNERVRKSYLSGLSVSDFVKKEHKLFFEALREMDVAQKSVDKISLLVQLEGKRMKKHEIWAICDKVSSVNHIKTHIEVLLSVSTRRSMHNMYIDIGGMISDTEVQNYDILKIIGDRVTELVTKGRVEEYTNDTIADEIRERVTKIKSGQIKLQGIFGVFNLDKEIALEGGELVVIAGASNTGKSWLGSTIACHSSLVLDMYAQVFSMEMTKEQVARRIMSYYCGIDADDIRRGLVDINSPEFLKGEKLFRNAKINLTERGGLTINELEGSIMDSFYNKSLKIVIIDHGLLMNLGEGGLEASRIKQMVYRLKALAKNLGIIIVLLWQLNKGVHNNASGKPSQKDIKDSSAVYDAADVVLMPWRPEEYGLEEYAGESTKDKTVIIIEKNRNGANKGLELFTCFDPANGGYFDVDPKFQKFKGVENFRNSFNGEPKF